MQDIWKPSLEEWGEGKSPLPVTRDKCSQAYILKEGCREKRNFSTAKGQSEKRVKVSLMK